MAGRYQKVAKSSSQKRCPAFPENTLFSVSIPYGVAKKIKHSVTLDVHRRDAHSGFATELGCPCDVRSTLDSDRTADIAGSRFRADFVAEVR
jgi:hypothetical protein